MMCSRRKKKNKSEYLKLNLLCMFPWQIEESKITDHYMFSFLKREVEKYVDLRVGSKTIVSLPIL